MGEGFLGRGLSTYMLVEHLTCAADQELSGQWGRILRGQILWIISQTVDTLVPRFWWWYGCERRHGGKRGKERGSGQGRDSIPLWKNRKRLLPTLVRLVRKMWGRSVGGGRGGSDGRVWNFFQPAPHVPLPKVQGKEFSGMGLVKASPPTLHLNSTEKCHLCLLNWVPHHFNLLSTIHIHRQP